MIQFFVSTIRFKSNASTLLALLFLSATLSTATTSVNAEPVYGYWKTYAENYRKSQDKLNLKSKNNCEVSCSDFDSKQPSQSLRYTTSLEPYQGFAYSIDNYREFQNNYTTSMKGGYGSYTPSPYEAYKNTYGDSSYTTDY